MKPHIIIIAQSLKEVWPPVRVARVDIMILFFIFYIAASHMAHVLFVCVYYTLLVVIIICIMFVKLRKCWRML